MTFILKAMETTTFATLYLYLKTFYKLEEQRLVFYLYCKIHSSSLELNWVCG